VTTAENSSAAISCAVAMVIVSNAVPAAITQVDARTGCKFTALSTILFPSPRVGQSRPRKQSHRSSPACAPKANGAIQITLEMGSAPFEQPYCAVYV